MVFKLVYIFLKKSWKVLICSKRLFGAKREWLVLATFIIIILAATRINFKQSTPISLTETKRLVENRLKEYYLEEKGKGCDIPKLDPFSAEAMEFNKEMPKITCGGNDWVVCHKSECYVKKEILEQMRDVSCTYRDIVYVTDLLYYLSDYTTVTGSEIYKLDKSDHVKISCTGTDKNSFGILYSRWTGMKAGLRPVQTQPIPPGREDSYNVMILAFDSASHNGFIRKMPKSYKFLADRAVILNGHNIVGDGTVAALSALLTGLAEHEHEDARKKITDKVFVDHKLFLFHQLKKYGYRTAYWEDTPNVGTFTYRFNGFRRQPADHYLRAFLLEHDKTSSFGNKFCIGDTPQYQLFLNLTNEFLQLEGKKFSLTFIADICHDSFNQIATADESVLWLLETLEARRVFEDTLVLVMGDHGSRFAGVRATYQGKLEERLPLMAIFLPEKLKKVRPEAFETLMQNVDILTTPFDIHSTMLDVLDLKHMSNKYRIPGSDLTRAMTLLEPIPKRRTCAEAGIVHHWCSCTKWFNVSESDTMYKRVANELAEYIDKVNEEQRSKCVKRKLLFINYVLELNVNKHLLKYGYSTEKDAFLGNPVLAAPRAYQEYYQAEIIMGPGRGVFQGTLTYNTQKDSFFVTKRDVSRISRYGTESECISETHPHLAPFCYCKHQRSNPRELDFN
ncbi:hypothetical protein PYW07_017042 [Mythimna separata]|uniref:Uncharacterized protein n=1 Tax=Mythimna separata TaxID=271217 RepID=A0AAD7YWZ2_MYTSE|nr:hypothetical protein PYW07_017042 [Mythimna separata]